MNQQSNLSQLAGMHIRLGLQLDGQHGAAFQPCVDRITTGPLGMLNLLETQLGLLRADTAHVVRVLQYRDCLKRRDGAERFYHRSFAVDPMGTADTLLNWRDQWHLHGWSSHTAASLVTSKARRLADMAEVEAETCERLAPSVGERLARVSDALSTRRARVAQVELCDPLTHWPFAWQRVLCVLTLAQPTPVAIAGVPGSLLADLQHALCALTAGGTVPKLKWRDDGSVCIVQAESPLLSAQWVAAELQKLDHASAEQTLLCSTQAALLDDVVVASHLPRQGFKESSPLRPALQVLPMVLGQLWKPVDIYGLLKFLTHPICPVSSVARRPLAEMIARSPGIGSGPAWEKALQEIQQACEGSEHFDWADVRDNIQCWLEHPRFEPATGIPLDALCERLALLARYFLGRLADKDVAKQLAFTSALSQTKTLLRSVQALALQGETHLGGQSLQTLLQQATAQGASNPLNAAQMGACRTVTQPGAAIDAAQTVIWWNLQAPAVSAAYPWSTRELEQLRECGVVLPEVSDLLAREALMWQRPVLTATSKLTLVLPSPGGEAHPLWLLVQSLFDKGAQPHIVRVESALKDSRLEPVAHKPLPEQKRWWQLPEGVSLPGRSVESYSSLEACLFNPYVWVLRYPAKLSGSRILDVSEGALLYGNLSHHMVERWLTRDDALTEMDAAFSGWFHPAFNELISQEGAVLLMPGRQEELASFKRKLQYAMAQLRSQLRAAGVITAFTEVKLEGHYVGGQISGFSDLLLTRGDGQKAILDLKWGSKSYQDKLAANRHVQLAIYGELVRQQTGQWPKLAYFSLSTGDLLATDSDYFPKAKQVRKLKQVAEEGSPHLWQRFLKTWRWRREQIERGEIEVVLQVHDDDLPPEDALAAEVLNPKYNEFLALAGWGLKS